MTDYLKDLKPYEGLYCEVDLKRCELHLITADSRHSIALPSELKTETPSLESQGHGLCLLNAAQGHFQHLDEWDIDTRYGLMISSDSCFVYREDDASRRRLAQSRQLIYPGVYRRQKGPGPFDLFVSQDQQYLAVSNRGEGNVMIVDLQSQEKIAEHHFKTLAGPKVISVALDGMSQSAWICSPDSRHLWHWEWGSEQVKAVDGRWRQPSAVIAQNQTLWLLETHMENVLHALSLPDLQPIARISLEGGSFAQDTDAPADLMHMDQSGDWLAVMTHVNVPEPFSPHVTVIHTHSRQADLEFQPAGRGFPMLLCTEYVNPVLQAAQLQQPLNAEIESEAQGLEKALFNSYGMNPRQLETHLLVVEAQQAPSMELPDRLPLAILEQIRQQFDAEYNVKIAKPIQTPPEQELMIQSVRLARLLRSHSEIQVLLMRALGQYNLVLKLNRAALLEQIKEQGDELGDIMADAASQEQDTSWALRNAENLPMNWTGLADPLNSRIFQLDPELNNVWSLETTLFGVYRPIDVCWLPEQRFVVLDSERNYITCWNRLAQKQWEIQLEEGNWNRLMVCSQDEVESLYVLDSQQGQLMQYSTDGEVLKAPKELKTGVHNIKDMCSAGQGRFWILGRSGQLNLWHPEEGLQKEIRFSGFPSAMGRSRSNNAVALFDGQVQKLWVLKDGESEAKDTRIGKNNPRYRINQPLGLQWCNDKEVIVYDRFRLLVIDVESADVTQQLLLQELKPSHNNLAPTTLFISKAQKAFQVFGGTQASLLKMLKRVPLFADVSANFLRALVMRVTTQVYSKGRTIVKRGEEGKEMFIIRQGDVAVLDSGNDHEVASMGVGDIFGEVALMLSAPRNATVTAKDYCEVFRIAQSELDALLPDYPDVKERLLELAQARQQQEKLRSAREREQLHSRVTSLMAKSDQSAAKIARGSRAHSQAAPEVKLENIEFWARHTQSGQMALLNRSGVVKKLLGPQQELVQPIAITPSMNGFWVLDRALNQLILLDDSLQQKVLEKDTWDEHMLQDPRGLCDAADGSLWVANTGAGEVLQLTARGELMQALSLGRAPTAIQVLDNQNLLICDTREHTVSEYNQQGELLWQFGTPRRFGRSDTLLFAPEYALRLSSGHILICDTGNSRVLEVDAEGKIHWSLVSSTALRVTRPSYARELQKGRLLIEHSNHFYWIEASRSQKQVWKYSLPVKGFHHLVGV